MTWTQFLTAIAVVYAIYYALNLLSDIMKSWKSGGENSDTEELFFREDVKTEMVAPNEESFDETSQDSGPRPAQGQLIQATGGVRIKQILELDRNDINEITKTINYGKKVKTK